jgi:hypothetical protein
VPRRSHSEQGLQDARDLSKPIQQELEKFFIATDELEDKKLEIIGWKGPKAAVPQCRYSSGLSSLADVRAASTYCGCNFSSRASETPRANAAASAQRHASRRGFPIENTSEPALTFLLQKRTFRLPID